MSGSGASSTPPMALASKDCPSSTSSTTLSEPASATPDSPCVSPDWPAEPVPATCLSMHFPMHVTCQWLRYAEPLEHGNFSKVRDECKDRRACEWSRHDERRQAIHGDSANSKRGGDRHIGYGSPDEPPAWTIRAHVRAFSIGIGGR